MKKFIYLVLLTITGVYACNKVPVGYLDGENAVYTPDSLIIKSTLNSEDPEDSRRIKFNIPWQSNPIQGLDGTPFLICNITSVEDENGINKPEILKQIFLIGAKARITIYINHSIPIGRYKLNLNVRNEDHEYYYPKIFTLIVE